MGKQHYCRYTCDACGISEDTDGRHSRPTGWGAIYEGTTHTERPTKYYCPQCSTEAYVLVAYRPDNQHWGRYAEGAGCEITPQQAMALADGVPIDDVFA